MKKQPGFSRVHPAELHSRIPAQGVRNDFARWIWHKYEHVFFNALGMREENKNLFRLSDVSYHLSALASCVALPPASMQSTLTLSWKERGKKAYFIFMFLNRLRFIKPANKGFIAIRSEICGTAMNRLYFLTIK
jgi:hypothetical protein